MNSPIADALGGAAQPVVPAGAKAGAKTESAAATAASDFQSFLKLLTAQLRNQDPLSPIDSTQFVEQLASFSAVEQQIQTNRLLTELTSGMSTSGLETATLWIGKNVEADVKSVRFAGEPVAFAAPSSAKGDFVVRNSRNEVVFRQPLGATRDISWDGRAEDGSIAPFADYAVAIETTDEAGKVSSTSVSIVSRVSEARLVDGGVRLLLEGGAVVEPGAINAIRSETPAPAPSTPAA